MCTSSCRVSTLWNFDKTNYTNSSKTNQILIKTTKYHWLIDRCKIGMKSTVKWRKARKGRRMLDHTCLCTYDEDKDKENMKWWTNWVKETKEQRTKNKEEE